MNDMLDHWGATEEEDEQMVARAAELFPHYVPATDVFCGEYIQRGAERLTPERLGGPPGANAAAFGSDDQGR